MMQYLICSRTAVILFMFVWLLLFWMDCSFIPLSWKVSNLRLRFLCTCVSVCVRCPECVSVWEICPINKWTQSRREVSGVILQQQIHLWLRKPKGQLSNESTWLITLIHSNYVATSNTQACCWSMGEGLQGALVVWLTLWGCSWALGAKYWKKMFQVSFIKCIETTNYGGVTAKNTRATEFSQKTANINLVIWVKLHSVIGLLKILSSYILGTVNLPRPRVILWNIWN